MGKNLDQDSKVTCVVNFFGPEDFLTMVRQPSTIDRTKGNDERVKLFVDLHLCGIKSDIPTSPIAVGVL